MSATPRKSRGSIEAKQSKLGVAKHLLRRAHVALMTDGDPLTCLVLAGSAEDLLQGLLKREGKATLAARHSVAHDGPAVIQALFPEEERAVSIDETIRTMRRAFNWVRHADREDEPLECEANWEFEAACALLRAALNQIVLTGENPFGTDEFIQLLWMMADNA